MLVVKANTCHCRAQSPATYEMFQDGGGIYCNRMKWQFFKLLEVEKLLQSLATEKQWCLLSSGQIDLRKSSVRETGKIG